ncbi:MAG: S-layer homology domain-containing protein, partial [Oscillospiraceae bacterium]|nr:S-layer homology domain-containing protein [Oscillospiraceae bacterium]
GVVNGIGENRFDPEGKITREQLAAILYRYAKVAGEDVSATADLTGFPDADSISPYAAEALSWAVAEGLINGNKEGDVTYLAPLASATRAQVAAILMRYLESQ